MKLPKNLEAEANAIAASTPRSAIALLLSGLMPTVPVETKPVRRDEDEIPF